MGDSIWESPLVEMIAAREGGMCSSEERYRPYVRFDDLLCAVLVEGIPDWRGMTPCMGRRDDERLRRHSRFAQAVRR